MVSEKQIVGIMINPDLTEAIDERGTFDKSRDVNIPLPLSQGEEMPEREVAKEQDAQGIKKEEDIDRIVTYLLERGRYRDAMLFVVGINTGLRRSDLVSLRFGDLIDERGFFIEDVKLVEIKTRSTRSKIVNRHIYLNEAVRKIIRIYLEHKPSSRGELMFRSERNGKNSGKGLSHTGVDKIFKPVTEKLGIEGRHSTHFLRKTFSYHLLMKSAGDKHLDSRSVEWLQMTLGHSSSSTTLKYAGYQSEEVQRFYKSLNLGLNAINKYLNK